MALQKLAPFESAALLYGLTPENSDSLKFYVRDDTFNICGRLLNTFGESNPLYQQCHSCATDGMETLVKLTGRNPCSYRIPRDIQTIQTSPYFEGRKDGKSPEDAYDCCLSSGADPKICVLDYMSEALLLPEKKPSSPPSLLASSPLPQAKSKKSSGISFLSVFLYFVVVLLLLFTIRKILLKR